MKGGFNKILRNIVAGSSDTEFEKRLVKATFHLDSKEPKEKHVIYLLESLNGEHKEQVSPIGALKFILERHISNLDNWSINTKILIILHRALQNKKVNRKVVKDLKKNEHLLHPFQKKNPENKYNIRMFMEISKLYCIYIKYFMNTCNKTDILAKPRKGFSEEVRKLKMADILKNYEYFESLSTQIFNLFQHTNFCKQTRLFSNLIFMLLKDLLEIYRIYYTHITEILERFPFLGKSEAQKAFVMYQNFVNLTEAIKNKANKLNFIFNFPITLPDFYNPEKGLIDTLRVVVQSAQEGGSNDEEHNNKVNAVSQQLRAGMNREQFEERKGGHDDEAITNQYFDCNALDRLMDENAEAPVEEVPEELKMDGEIDLFQMIDQSDFSTVGGEKRASMAQAAAAQGAEGGAEFNFGDMPASVDGSAQAQANAADFFNFGSEEPAQAQAAASAQPEQPAGSGNDLFDVFSNPAPAQGNDNAAGQGAASADPLADIFSQGSQPLASNPNAAMPAGDKTSVLSQFYQNQNQPPPGMNFVGGPTAPQANNFQTHQQLPGNNPFAMMMGGAGGMPQQQQNTMQGGQPGFQPMMGQYGTAMPGMGGMGGMGMQQPAPQQLPGFNPFDAMGGGQPAAGGFNTMQQQQPSLGGSNPFGQPAAQAQPAPQQQQQQQQNNTADLFNF